MVAFQDGTIYDVATKVGDYDKTGGVPDPASSRHWTYDVIGWTDVHRKYVKVKVNTLMYGQFSLATDLSSLLIYSKKSPRLILI